MKFIPCTFLTTLVLLQSSAGHAQQPGEKPSPSNAAPAETKKPTREELEKQFADKLTGAILVGSYTRDGKDLSDLKTDRYELKKVEKLQGDTWNFQAHIKYGDLDAILPIPLTVLWAGDTPMITMTNTTVPTMGTFTVRILFYGDRYAGTWQHGPVGGHMFGRIEKAAAAGADNGKPKAEPPKP